MINKSGSESKDPASPSSPDSAGAAPNAVVEYLLVLDNLPEHSKVKHISTILKKRNLACKKVEILSKQESVQFPGTGSVTLSAKLHFESKSDLVKVAEEVVNKQSFTIANGKSHNLLQMRILKAGAQFNPDTSVVVRKLNFKCTEIDLIQEINQIFFYNKNYRKEIRKWEEHQALVKQGGEKNGPKKSTISEDLFQYFVLACTVVKNSLFRFAIIDLDCLEATQVLIKAWDERFMEMYPSDTLEVNLYNSDFKKQRQLLRAGTVSRERNPSQTGPIFTNLYIEKLPAQFDEKHVLNIFSNYGVIKSVKIKKPPSFYQNSNHNPCSAYVDFETHDQALKAQKALNGKQLLPGSNFIRIEFYRKDNRFLGVHRGLDRNELLQNTHYRVLFIRGMNYSISKEELQIICEKYGQVDVITLKTKVDDTEVLSRGIAIVQFSTKDAAANALKGLPFEERLGDISQIEIEFYQSKESRMINLEMEENKAHEIQLSNVNPQFKKLVLSEPVQQVIKEVRDRLVSVSASRERLHRDKTTNSNSRSKSLRNIMNPMSMAFYPNQVAAMPIMPNPMADHPRVLPTPVDEFECPHYFIKPIFAPARQRPNQYGMRQGTRPYQEKKAQNMVTAKLNESKTFAENQRGRNRHNVAKAQPPKEKKSYKDNRKLLDQGAVYKRKDRVDRRSLSPQQPQFEIKEVKVQPQKRKSRVADPAQQDQNRAPSQHSFKLDMESVYSQKTKDFEEEEALKKLRQEQRKASQKAMQSEFLFTRARSWRNPNLAKRDPLDDTSESTITTKIEKVTLRKAGRSHRQKGASGRSPMNKASPRKHSYSPRYIEFLHISPHNSPRDEQTRDINIQMGLKKKPMFGVQVTQTKPAFLRKIQKDIIEESKGVRFDDTQDHIIGKYQRSQKKNYPHTGIPHNHSQTFNTKDLMHQKFISGYDSPVQLGEQGKLKAMFTTPFNPTSPQPCVSPSSLINALYEREEHGFSAPFCNDYPTIGMGSMNSFSDDSETKKKAIDTIKEVKQMLEGEKQQKKPSTGLFNYDWDSEDEDKAST